MFCPRQPPLKPGRAFASLTLPHQRHHSRAAGSCDVKADRPLPFRVSDAGRRRKVGDARTRGPRAVTYGDFAFGRLWVLEGSADMRT
jgi:hypothetical protein